MSTVELVPVGLAPDEVSTAAPLAAPVPLGVGVGARPLAPAPVAIGVVETAVVTVADAVVGLVG